jgi:hypothetical protein
MQNVGDPRLGELRDLGGWRIAASGLLVPAGRPAVSGCGSALFGADQLGQGDDFDVGGQLVAGRARVGDQQLVEFEVGQRDPDDVNVGSEVNHTTSHTMKIPQSMMDFHGTETAELSPVSPRRRLRARLRRE